jgi:hypothetical protein
MSSIKYKTSAKPFCSTNYNTRAVHSIKAKQDKTISNKTVNMLKGASLETSSSRVNANKDIQNAKKGNNSLISAEKFLRVDHPDKKEAITPNAEEREEPSLRNKNKHTQSSNSTVTKTSAMKKNKLYRQLKPLALQFSKTSTNQIDNPKKTDRKASIRNLQIEDKKQENEALMKKRDVKQPSKMLLKSVNYSTINTTYSNNSNTNSKPKTPSSFSSEQKYKFSLHNKIKEPVSTKNAEVKQFKMIFNSLEISKEAQSFDEDVNNNSCDYFKLFYSNLIMEKQLEAEGKNSKSKAKDSKTTNTKNNSLIKSLKKTTYNTIKNDDCNKQSSGMQKNQLIKVIRANSKSRQAKKSEVRTTYSTGYAYTNGNGKR